MPTSKKNSKSEASKEMRDPKASKQEKSAAAKEMASDNKKKK
ncbi:hypothetical protein [uncultured Mucilaginibacter sp.]|nr:hypothetical protein [uncultured Mucilaginibacter sp.]